MDSQASQFKVRFAHSRDEAQRGLQPMTVVIYPHDDRWDDLGYLPRRMESVTESPQLSGASIAGRQTLLPPWPTKRSIIAPPKN